MKKLFAILLAAVAIFGFSQCGSSKKATPNVAGEQLIETYCSGPEFQSNKDFFRANAISESMDQQVSRQKALTQARTLLAQQLQVTLKNVTDAYVNSTSHNTVEDLGQRYEGLTREVTNQKLSGTRTICEKTTRTQAGNYKTYVALELSGEEVMGAMKAKISADEKLRIDYDYEKFKKTFEDEMGKME
ncbi:MAG: hypothetical protein ACOYMF_18165 [Bacteroidales bacterium]